MKRTAIVKVVKDNKVVASITSRVGTIDEMMITKSEILEGYKNDERFEVIASNLILNKITNNYIVLEIGRC